MKKTIVFIKFALLCFALTGCAKAGKETVNLVEQQFAEPLAALRSAAISFAESDDGSVLRKAKGDLARKGVVMASLLNTGQRPMPNVSFMKISRADQTRDPGSKRLNSGTATLEDGNVLNIVTYYASVTNSSGKEITYSLTVTRESLEGS